MRLGISTAIVLSAATSGPATEPLIGIATVIDGDTIELHGERIRLLGIDAPESGQLCHGGGGASYRCGQKAALALADQHPE